MNYGIVGDHPELVDLNFVLNPNIANADWNHTNSVNYNEEFDQIILSVHNFDEIWIIDHSTAMEEAASHEGGTSGKGGDLLYRWGNPETYDAGATSERKLFGQHDAQWIESGYPGEGKIIIFNNGLGRNYSTIDEILPPVDSSGNYFLSSGFAYEPEEQLWIYEAENRSDFYSQNISGVQRLPNGNTLICSGSNGTFFEIDQNKVIVWHYINPVTMQGVLTQGDSPEGEKNDVFKIRRYGYDYPGLLNRDLTPRGTIELILTDVENHKESDDLNVPEIFNLSQNYPNPFNPSTQIVVSIPESGQYTLIVYNVLGQKIATLLSGQITAGTHTITFDDSNLMTGIYLYNFSGNNFNQTKKMMLMK